MNKYDLNLPEFGPYSKKFAGISHIFEEDNPWRFDLAVFTGQFRRFENISNVRYDSSFHPWASSPDANYFSYRIENIKKDILYTEISFMKINDISKLIQIQCVNNSNQQQNLSLHLIASLEGFSPNKHSSKLPLQSIKLNNNCQLLSALDYTDYQNTPPSYNDNLYYDGRRKGEIFGEKYYNFYALEFSYSQPYYKEYSDKPEIEINTEANLTYLFDRSSDSSNYNLYLKIYASNNTNETIPSNTTIFLNKKHKIIIDSEKLNQARQNNYPLYVKIQLNIEDFDSISLNSQKKISLKILNSNLIVLDYLLLEAIDQDLEKEQVLSNKRVVFIDHIPTNLLQISEHHNAYDCNYHYDDIDGTLHLLYPHFNLRYTLRLIDNKHNVKCRNILNDDLDPFLHEYIHEHVQSTIIGNCKGQYIDLFIAPVSLEPNSQETVYAIIEKSTINTLSKQIDDEGYTKSTHLITNNFIENLKAKFEQSTSIMDSRDKNNPYKFSIQLMNATISTNTVYPVRINNHYVKHSTPGRWWDSVYTWDSGFIGLGLACQDINRSIDTLKMYLSYGLEKDQAFLHHGSLIPTQFYQFEDLISRINKWETKLKLINELYPNLKKCLLFFLGDYGSSTTNNQPFLLLRPWDYFYNSGGWDDYPAQVAMHKFKLQNRCSPVITTSHAIRFCKIMLMVSELLNLKDDQIYFNNKISLLQNALHQFSWDEKEEIFSYVVSENSNTTTLSKLYYNESTNYNHGLDGISPIFASACTREQTSILWGKILDKNHYWTNIGISSVDLSAPYYSNNGYWNGCVWFPYQYLFFKTMLDCNMANEAYSLAHNLLNIWKKEVESTYNCYEHFMIKSESGLGWHQFSGLSSPIVALYETYYSNMSVKTGFDLTILNKKLSENNNLQEVELYANESGNKLIIISSKDSLSFVTSKEITNIYERERGLYELTISVEKGERYIIKTISK